MAAADYRLCDVCGVKSFYDSELNYDFDKYPDTGLFNLGNWVCLCRECSETHDIAILKKASFTCNGFCGEQECKENQDDCKRIKKESGK